MKEVSGTLVLTACGFAVVVGFAVGAEYFGLGWAEHFGLKWKDLRREQHEASQSFNRGKLQQLSKYYKEYLESDENSKAAIKNLISVDFANYDAERIPNEILKKFLIEVRGF